MAAAHDPAVQRTRLRTELRRARQEARKTQAEVAEAMDWSVSKVLRIEGGDVKISRNDLRVLLDYYRVTDPEVVESLLDAAKEAGRAGILADFRDVYDSTFLRYAELERAAARIYCYWDVAIPGLLQTEEYATQLQRHVTRSTEADAERRWQLRSRRQEILEREDPVQLQVLLDEAALRRPVAGPTAFRRQLERLRELNTRPNISIRMLRFAAGPYVGMGTPFTILDFDDPQLDDVLYLEDLKQSTVKQHDPEQTSVHLRRFFAMQEVASTAEDTNQLIEQLMDQLEYAGVGRDEQ